MRWIAFVLVLAAACGDDDGPAIDAAAVVDGAVVDGAVVDGAMVDGAVVDAAAIDAPAIDAVDAVEVDACTSVVRLTGGTDPVAQGWTVIQQPRAFLTMPTADTTVLTTESSISSSTGGQLLLVYDGAVPIGAPFVLEVVMRVDGVVSHNQFDAAVAIMGSFTAPAGTSAERAQMIFVDRSVVGWADDTQEASAFAYDGAFHTYRLAVDAARTATVSRDGIALLTRANFTTNGRIAIGDQTNDYLIDGQSAIRSITTSCP